MIFTWIWFFWDGYSFWEALCSLFCYSSGVPTSLSLNVLLHTLIWFFWGGNSVWEAPGEEVSLDPQWGAHGLDKYFKSKHLVVVFFCFSFSLCIKLMRVTAFPVHTPAQCSLMLEGVAIRCVVSVCLRDLFSFDCSGTQWHTKYIRFIWVVFDGWFGVE